jgi:hypothetical protein
LHSYDAATDHEHPLHHHHHHQHSNGLMSMDRHQEKLLLKASLRKERDIKEKAKNIDGSYQCPFCDKSFPRLGYLKKHEQVSFFLFKTKNNDELVMIYIRWSPNQPLFLPTCRRPHSLSFSINIRVLQNNFKYFALLV